MPAACEETGASAAPGCYPPFPAGIFCTKCGYNLFGCVSDRCPECGRSLVNMRAAESRIPWVHRREIGRFRAYWRTVWMVTFRGGAFLDEYARALSVSDAWRFNGLTTLHVLGQALAAAGVLYLVVPWKIVRAGALEVALREVWPVAIAVVCLPLFTLAISGVNSHFFHPRGLSVERQDSAVAMSLYGCGMLAFAPTVLTIIVGSGLFIARASWPTEHVLASLLVPAAAVFAVWWASLVSCGRRLMPEYRRWWVLMAVALPVLWTALAGLLLIALPMAIVFVSIVLRSLG